MKVSREEENFYRLISLMNNCILPQLRALFKDKWNEKFPSNQWRNSKEKGEELLDMIKGAKRDILLKMRLLEGDTDEWDITCVIKALSAVDIDPTENKRIEKLKDIRNYVSHNSDGRCKDGSKDEIFKGVKGIFVEFGWATEQVEKIEHETLTTEDVEILKTKLGEEKRTGKF